MRYAIFGDIHGNLEALQTVVEQLQKDQIDEYLCTGDIVGYGANPEECVELVRELGALCVAGNHDHAATGCLDVSFFNQHARQAAEWTAEHLSEISKEWIQSLSFIEHAPHFVLVHGSLQAPEMFNYIQTVRDAEYSFRMLDKAVCFCGHSHVPLTFFDTDPMTYSLDSTIPVDPAGKTIINVGSVGQPRDERPEASYAVYDTHAQSVEVHRVEYDIETAANKISDASLPQALALRLWLGK